MPSTWFNFGLQQTNDQADYWEFATLNVSLIADVATVSVDPSWTDMSQFKDANPTMNLISQQTFAGRTTPVWNNPYYGFPFTGEINFGAVADARTLGGVLMHEGDNTVDTSKIVAVYEESDSGLGGDVKWGSAGTNWALSIIPENFNGTRTFNGGIEQQVKLANAWGASAAAVTFGFTLLQGTNTLNGNERTMQEVAGKVTYCTNAGPDQSATPILTIPADTVLPAWEVVNGLNANSLQYLLQSVSGGATQVEWLWANGLQNETITAVLVYSFDSAGYVATQAFPWHYQPVTPHPISTNQNIRFGNMATIQNLVTRIRAA